MAERDFDANEIMVALNAGISEDVQEIGLAILRNVVLGTPVGDPTLWQNPDSAPPGYVGGHARRNWRVSVRSPDESVTGTAGRGGGAGAARSEAINAGIGKLARFRLDDRRLIIQNNVPYIGVLNTGHSTQAPRNFVETAVQVAQNVGRNRREVLD